MLRRLFILLCCVSLSITGQAWGRDRFDEALDRYAAICDRCLELRNAVEEGVPIPESELRSLLEQIATLRRTLQGATGQMSAAQRQRFVYIRDRFLGGGRPGIQVLPPVSRDPVPVVPAPVFQPILREPEPVPAAVPAPRLHPFLLVSMGISSHPDVGLMAGLTVGRWGGYVSGRSRFTSPAADYSCLSDRSTAYGTVWLRPDAPARYPSEWLTSGGLFGVSGRVWVYAGAGYGRQEVIWEDIDGARVRVSDRSAAGCAIEAGCLFMAGRWAVSAGIGSRAGRSLCPVVGLGLRL